MTNIPELYQEDQKVISVELNPPRNGSSVEVIDQVVESLKDQGVRYFSVTHGAGGSLKGGTLPLTARLQDKHQVNAMAHLTCRWSSKAQIEDIVVDAQYLGIENILALRGDPPIEGNGMTKHPQSYKFASEFVEHLNRLKQGKYMKRTNDYSNENYRKGNPFNHTITVACYPEGHQEARSLDDDVLYFKEKVDKGANLAITQMIFDASKYKAFMDLCKQHDIDIPIIPGVYPLRSYRDIDFIPKKFGVSMPAEVYAETKGLKDKPEQFNEWSNEFTAQLVKDLFQYAPGVQFYSMNDSARVSEIIKRI
jgi:methylenetetrahydrofolate reductase (NADPH)